jgi:hypothetical protein
MSHPKGYTLNNPSPFVNLKRKGQATRIKNMFYSGFGLNEIVNCDKFISIVRGHFIRILNDVIYILSMCDPKN